MGDQPAFTIKAHVFFIEPNVKKEWTPGAQGPVPVNIFFDSVRNAYRVISIVDAKAVVNSALSGETSFIKTSHKFGQWLDTNTGVLYGLGFDNEQDLNSFSKKFNHFKDLPPGGPGSGRSPAQSRDHKANSFIPDGDDDEEVILREKNGDLYRYIGDLQIEKLPQVPLKYANLTGSTTPTPMDDLHELPAHSSDEEAVYSPSTSSAPGDDIMDGGRGRGRGRGRGGGGGKGRYSDDESQLEEELAKQKDETDRLKAQMDQLKAQLEQVQKEGKKKDEEIGTLKKNNSKLTNALKESAANVEEWKKLLHKYREESLDAKNKISELEAEQRDKEHTQRAQAMDDERVGALENTLRDKDREVDILNKELVASQNEGTRLQNDNNRLKDQLYNLNNQLDKQQQERDKKKRENQESLAQINNKLQEVQMMTGSLQSNM